MIYSIEIHSKKKFSLHFESELSKIFIPKENLIYKEEEIPIESSEEFGCENENIINATLKEPGLENDDIGDSDEPDDEGYVKGVEGIFVTKHRIKIVNGIFFKQSEMIDAILSLIDPTGEFKKVDMP